MPCQYSPLLAGSMCVRWLQVTQTRSADVSLPSGTWSELGSPCWGWVTQPLVKAGTGYADTLQPRHPVKACLEDDQEVVFFAKPQHTPWESTGQEATQQVRRHAHKGVFPREMPVPCTWGVLTLAISPNARSLTSSSVIMASSANVLLYKKAEKSHPITCLIREARLLADM